MRKNNSFIVLLLIGSLHANAQQLPLEKVLATIEANHPGLKMFDADIRSMDAAAKGANSWMPPEVSTGFWMMPYNPQMWKRPEMGGTGMGQYMLGVQQMFPNQSRQRAEAAYMNSMSAIEKENRRASLNELTANARSAYYAWVIQYQKLAVIGQNEKLLDFMIRNAEIRYKNNMGKLNAYYKAKGALGELELMKEMTLSEIEVQRIRLSALMNAPVDSTAFPDTIVKIAVVDVAIDSMMILSSRSDIKALDRQQQANILQQQFEKSKLKPEFGLKYDHMFGFGGLPQQFNLMAMVKIPMASWSSRMNKATVESLRFKNESLQQKRQMLILESTGMALEMQLEIRAKSRQLEIYRNSIIPSLKNNYQSMLLAYEQNTEELYMLYDAWEALNMAQLQYLDELNAFYQANIQQQRILENR